MQLPLSASDAAQLLAGTTGGYRATSIVELARVLKPDPTGAEVATVLGTTAQLAQADRFAAIAALGRAGRLPCAPSGTDAAAMLAGTMQAQRVGSIGELAPCLAAGLSGAGAAATLGGNGETTEANRMNAIAALARAGKLQAPLDAQGTSLVLQGIGAGNRPAAFAEIAANATRAERAGT